MKKLINKQLKKDSKLLTFYLTAGYPDKNQFFKALEKLVAGGMNILEIGVPNPNPQLDGKTIKKTHNRVLNNGFEKQHLLDYLKEIKDRYPNLPLVVMTYQDIIEKYNLLEVNNYYDGLLCPDKTLTDLDVSTVQIYKQTMSDEEIKKKLAANQGFAYAVSGQKKTGSQGKLPTSYRKLLNRIRNFSSLPVQVGFGIHKPQQVKKVLTNGADGAIIGSEIIRRLNKSSRELANYVQKLDEVRKQVV